MSQQTLHRTKLLLYCLLSAADLLLTYQLVCRSDGLIYESNPIANAWLTSYGWSGLALFKMIAMLLVVGVALFVGRQRQRAAGIILSFACLAVGLVVTYSSWLMGYLGGQPAYARENVEEWSQVDEAFEEQMQAGRAFQLLAHHLATQLDDEQITMPQAVAELQLLARTSPGRWLACVRARHPGRSEEGSLTAELGVWVRSLRSAHHLFGSAPRQELFSGPHSGHREEEACAFPPPRRTVFPAPAPASDE
jgi:hypothetical protein